MSWRRSSNPDSSSPVWERLFIFCPPVFATQLGCRQGGSGAGLSPAAWSPLRRDCLAFSPLELATRVEITRANQPRPTEPRLNAQLLADARTTAGLSVHQLAGVGTGTVPGRPMGRLLRNGTRGHVAPLMHAFAQPLPRCGAQTLNFPEPPPSPVPSQEAAGWGGRGH
jgi:hypothetical protein